MGQRRAVRRGDVFSVSMRGAAAKPRPGIIVQATELLRADRIVLICPLTSELADASLLRVDVEPSAENGLRQASQVMVDQLSAALP